MIYDLLTISIACINLHHSRRVSHIERQDVVWVYQRIIQVVLIYSLHSIGCCRRTIAYDMSDKRSFISMSVTIQCMCLCLS